MTFFHWATIAKRSGANPDDRERHRQASRKGADNRQRERGKQIYFSARLARRHFCVPHGGNQKAATGLWAVTAI
jgi:hypothetical protein